MQTRSTHQAAIERAAALLSRGKLTEAKAACRQLLSQSPGNAEALHLLGLACKDDGDATEGERLMRESIAIDPRNADFRANLANLLHRLGQLPDAVRSYRDALALTPNHRSARLGLTRALHDLGSHADAEAECRQLIAASSADPQAWTALAMALRSQHRLVEAEAAYRQAIALKPDYGAAHHNLGSLLSQAERAEEALAALSRAGNLGISGFELAFNRGRTLVQLYRTAEAEQAFAEAVALNPRHREAQLNLAGLRYMRGDPTFARDIAAAAAADSPAMQLLFGTVLRRAGDLESAERVLRNLLARRGNDPDARCALAQVLQDAGRLTEAETEAMTAAIDKPGDPFITEILVTILLSRGRPDDAQPFVRAQRAKFPIEQGWIAHEATIARLLGLPSYHELYDYSRLIRTYEVEPPAGWSSMDELNSALRTALDTRHPFAIHPLDQSLRYGSQTSRSLLTEKDPAIQAVLRAFEAPLEDYRRAIGTQPDHPVSSRNRGAVRIAGAWSVQLRRNGFHVNHVHPQGWISSAYYVAVPDEVQDMNLMSGWLKFGEPRFAVPGATPEVFVPPLAGRLVLFPSYLWHGTNPIYGPQTRTTIAFDAVPTESR